MHEQLGHTERQARGRGAKVVALGTAARRAAHEPPHVRLKPTFQKPPCSRTTTPNGPPPGGVSSTAYCERVRP